MNIKNKFKNLSTRLGEIAGITVIIILTASAIVMLLALLKACLLFLIG